MNHKVLPDNLLKNNVECLERKWLFAWMSMENNMNYHGHKRTIGSEETNWLKYLYNYT